MEALRGEGASQQDAGVTHTLGARRVLPGAGPGGQDGSRLRRVVALGHVGDARGLQLAV